MSAHTSGPWGLKGVMAMDTELWLVEIPGRRAARLEVPNDDSSAEGDARLIAAAPEMFDELRKCLEAELRRRADLKNKSPAARYSDERIERIEALIRKVRGES